MIINKFTKMKDGMYKLKLDNDVEVKLHEDLILKYDLLINKNISEDLLLDLEKENIKYESYNLALKYLKNRQRCNKEIYTYLKSKGISNLNIDFVIDILTKQGYLNEEVYITSYINDRIYLSSDGPLKIKKYLTDMNLDNDVINEKLLIFTEELEKERISKLIKKLEKSNKKGEYNFKLKVKTYLTNLGYHTEYINYLLNNYNIDDTDLKQKEYDKLYKKYSKKYNGYELEYKIKQGLYQKGFR